MGHFAHPGELSGLAAPINAKCVLIELPASRCSFCLFCNEFSYLNTKNPFFIYRAWASSRTRASSAASPLRPMEDSSFSSLRLVFLVCFCNAFSNRNAPNPFILFFRAWAASRTRASSAASPLLPTEDSSFSNLIIIFLL